MSTSIYTYIPHFYIIQHINSGKFYAGVRYGKNSNPDQLLKSNGYQTSSDVVKQIILEEGLESFIIRKIRVFETGKEALEYEYRYLRRVNAAFNDNFLNRSNCSIDTLNVDWGKYKKTNLSRYGFEYATQSPEIKEKSKNTCLENFGCEFSMQSEIVKEKKKQTFLKNHGVANPSQVPEFQEKKKQTFFKKYGVSHPSQTEEFQEKRSQTVNIRNNRPTVLLIRKYRDEFKLKLGSRWFWKPQEFLDGMLAELKITYDLEQPILNSKEKIRQNLNINYNRPIVLEIRNYRDKFKLKLGNGWFWKPQEFLDNLLAELKLTYDLEHPILNSKEKRRQTIINMKNRPTVLLIKQYKEKFNPKLIHCWYWKPQEILDTLLAELKLSYGEISENI